MIEITNGMVNKINKKHELYNEIRIFVDYEKEAEYSALQSEIYKNLQDLSNDEFSCGDIECLLNIVDTESDEYYIYTADEALECVYPEDDFIMLHNAFNWIDSKQQIAWLCNFVFSEKLYYNHVNNLNDNYIISSIPLDSL